jgi:hypothetical protein
MDVSQITKAELARWADVSKVAIHKAAKRGDVRLTGDGQADLSSKHTLAYLGRMIGKKVIEQHGRRKLRPGWACLAAELPSGGVVPLVFLPPYGNELTIDFTFYRHYGAEIDTGGDHWTATIGGETFPLMLIEDGENLPPWRAEDKETKPQEV